MSATATSLLDPQTRATAPALQPPDGEQPAAVASAMPYVWALDRRRLAAVVAIARQRGFVPATDPIYVLFVPEASGPAWIVYVQPAA